MSIFVQEKEVPKRYLLPFHSTGRHKLVATKGILRLLLINQYTKEVEPRLAV